MLVPSLLEQVHVHLVTQYQLVAAVAYAYGRRVDLVAVTDVYAVEVTADEHRNRVCRTVRNSSVEHFLIVGVNQTARNIAAPRHAVGPYENGRMYSKKRISQLNIVSSGQIKRRIYLQFVCFAQFDERRSDMLGRHADIPRAVRIIQAEAYVEGASVDFRRREGRVARVLHVEFGTVEALAQQSQLHTGADHAAEQPVLVSVLQRKALVGEQSYLVVKQRNAHAVIVFQQIQRHVRPDVHRLGIVLEPGEAHGIRRGNVQLLLLANGPGVVIRLQVPIMAERHVVLRAGLRDGEQQQR